MVEAQENVDLLLLMIFRFILKFFFLSHFFAALEAIT
jgi:hypothetical protein